ncbi:disulfide bond formation protein B 1 [Legionella antarctica]|uniref:Disulfide bond formation protein B n=1 Tax=Legionella antarctica TaxID=2708020 RepID=A0A6F8T907_9GAMM|nr:disulfide bond formation protein B [Legionella antarctica]BCA96838.1 disulfide bond formation protein B 1 [Legionella antarctica]
MRKITFKKIQLFLVLVTFIVLFASFYFEYFLGLRPCPLCIMQRVCVFLLLGLMGLSLGTLKKAHLICLIQVVISCTGLFFSLRQLWLQSLPAGKAPACMPDLDVLIRYFPWQTVARALFWGAGDCAEVTWSMAGISMPGWVALYFLFMALTGLVLYFRTRTLN